jgi:hypothetical protein
LTGAGRAHISHREGAYIFSKYERCGFILVAATLLFAGSALYGG